MYEAVVKRIEAKYPHLLAGTDMPLAFIIWGYELGENKDLKETYLKFLASWEAVDMIFQKHLKNPEDFVGTAMHKKLLLAHYYGGDRELFKADLKAMVHHRASHGTTQEVTLKHRGLTKAEFAQLLAAYGSRIPLRLAKVIDRGFVKQVPRDAQLFQIYKDTLEQTLKDEHMQSLLKHIESLNQLENLLYHYANIRPKRQSDYDLLISALYGGAPGHYNKYLIAYFADFEANEAGGVLLNKQQCEALIDMGHVFGSTLIPLREQYPYDEIANAFLYAKGAVEDNNKTRMHKYMQTYLQCTPAHDFGTRAKAYAGRVYNYFIGDSLHWARKNPKKTSVLAALFLALTVLMLTISPVERLFHLAGSQMEVSVPNWIQAVNGAGATVGARVMGQRFARTRLGTVLMGLLPRSLVAGKAMGAVYKGSVHVVKRTDVQDFQAKLDSLLTPSAQAPSPASKRLALALSPQVKQANRAEVASPMAPQVKPGRDEPFVPAIPGLSA